MRQSRAKTQSVDFDSRALENATYKRGDLYLTFARDGAQ
jgi:hypothetical protein